MMLQLLLLPLFFLSHCRRSCSAATQALASRSVEGDDIDRDRHHRHIVHSVNERELKTEHHHFLNMETRSKAREEDGKALANMMIESPGGDFVDDGEPMFKAVEQFPTAGESTVLFLHVFKVTCTQDA